MLIGDVDGNGTVDAADVVAIEESHGKKLDKTNFLADLDLNGKIEGLAADAADSDIAEANNGHAVGAWARRSQRAECRRCCRIAIETAGRCHTATDSELDARLEGDRAIVRPRSMSFARGGPDAGESAEAASGFDR